MRTRTVIACSSRDKHGFLARVHQMQLGAERSRRSPLSDASSLTRHLKSENASLRQAGVCRLLAGSEALEYFILLLITLSSLALVLDRCVVG